MLALPNLSSQALVEMAAPWDYQPEQPIQDMIRKNKKMRDIWANNPQTRHQFYSFNEGMNPLQRISAERDDGEGNPIRSQGAMAVDFDSPQTREKAIEYAKNCIYVPNKLERTLSGNWRAVWGYERELLFPSTKVYIHYQKKFPEFAFDPSRVMPGFDKNAWESPNRMWTNGCEWIHLHDTLIPAAITQGWMVQACKTFKFTEQEFGPAIPLELVKEELAKKYPRFHEWEGDFIEQSQGPTFWVTGSTSPKSAIVRETGMQTFAAHAAKGFYRWADLLGIDFVRQFEAKRMGIAVEGIYFDGVNYWYKSSGGLWQPWSQGDTELHLQQQRGLSKKVDSTGATLIKQALSFIHENQRVSAALPLVYKDEGLVRFENETRLNISDVKVLPPSAEPGVYGPDGNFPFLSAVLKMFPEGRPFDTNMSWLHRAYKAGYDREPCLGQVLFICGPKGQGKTFWVTGVVAALLGGMKDATVLLSGDANFNSDMFAKPLWVLDDGTPSADNTTRIRYSHTIKRIAANRRWHVNGKYEKPYDIDYFGRTIVVMNADANSIRLLPDTTLSNRDKLIFIQTVPHDVVVFGTAKEIKEILDRELPYFARYVLDWKIPDYIQGQNRFGIQEYQDPNLLDIAEQMNPMEEAVELLEMWGREYFMEVAPDAKTWEGRFSDLHQCFVTRIEYDRMWRAVRAQNPVKLNYLIERKFIERDPNDISRLIIRREVFNV